MGQDHAQKHEQIQKLRLNFEAGEWMGLQALAFELNTDVGSVLRMCGLMILEAHRKGLLHRTEFGAALGVRPQGGTN